MRFTGHHGATGRRERGRLAKIFPTLFCGVFLAAGLWMSWHMVRGLLRTADRYRWEPAPCTFTASEWNEDAAASSSQRYTGRAAYRYTWQGSEYRGEASATFGSVGDAQRFRDLYAPGTLSQCLVNPAAPQESAVERPSPWIFLTLLFPMTFVAAGAIPIVLLWKPRRDEKSEEQTPRVEALTRKTGGNALAGCVMVGFFLVFLLAGSAVMWFLTGRPLVRIADAKSWVATPCTVLASEVVSHPGDDGTTYSALVRYRYQVGGREYQSDRYDFSTGSTSSSAGYQEVVDRFPPESGCTCFVDPRDPTRAVLDRGFRKAYWIGLFGLPFFAVGAGGLIFLARTGLRKAAPVSSRAERGAAAAPVTGPLLLRSRSGPWKKFFGSLAVNLFWNGIVGVFIFVIARDWRAGNGEWFPILILTPFALIGLLLLGALPHAFLGLFNPRPQLELDRAECAPGESVSGRFRLSGLLGRADRLEITLEGKEAATLTTRSGGKSSTSRQEKMFHRSVVYESGAGAAVDREAQISVEVPADTMHSFSSSNNEVRWALQVRIEIRRWPDIDEQFALRVPAKRSWR
jgi:hypothetical protein